LWETPGKKVCVGGNGGDKYARQARWIQLARKGKLKKKVNRGKKGDELRECRIGLSNSGKVKRLNRKKKILGVTVREEQQNKRRNTVRFKRLRERDTLLCAREEGSTKKGKKKRKEVRQNGKRKEQNNSVQERSF